METMSCMLVDVINMTLASCDYTHCEEACKNYLWLVANNCSHVFNNQTYNELWRTLISICYLPSH